MISFFILTYGVFFYFHTASKDKIIENSKQKQLKDFRTHYELTESYFSSDSKSIKQNLTRDPKVREILEKSQKASSKELAVLRNALYEYLLPMYQRIHSRGILQLQFVFPNNISFLRMHKENKFGDDLSDIRYSFNYVNKNKKEIRGFERGRTTHAFRYAFPFFGKDGKHLGAVEISLSSYALQKKLLSINKIHSHFLINKEIFETEKWSEKEVIAKYQQSIEHPDYLLTETEELKHSKLVKYEKKGVNRQEQESRIVDPLKERIKKGFSSGKEFVLHFIVDKTFNILVFLPILNTKKDKVVAYLVLYVTDPNAYIVIRNYNIINVKKTFRG